MHFVIFVDMQSFTRLHFKIASAQSVECPCDLRMAMGLPGTCTWLRTRTRLLSSNFQNACFLTTFSDNLYHDVAICQNLTIHLAELIPMLNDLVANCTHIMVQLYRAHGLNLTSVLIVLGNIIKRQCSTSPYLIHPLSKSVANPAHRSCFNTGCFSILVAIFQSA